MGITNIISSLNVISLTAFIVTLGFLIYQIYLIKHEFSHKKGRPIIPDFDDKIAVKKNVTPVYLKSDKTLLFKRNSGYFFIMIIFLVIFLLIFVIFGGVFLSIQKSHTSGVQPTPVVNYVASQGIRIYNKNWKELREDELRNIKADEEIIVAIETIPNTDVDMARLRVNKDDWRSDDITSILNKNKNVYYKEYTISSQTAVLKIDAQLHSKSGGWLGD